MSEEVSTPAEILDEDLIPLVFSEEAVERKVKIGTTDYVLREMMGADLGKWQQYDAGRMKLVKNRLEMSPDAFKTYAATLINYCLFPAGKYDPVPIKTIMSWRSTIITGLFNACQTLNGLTLDSQDKAKKA